MYGLPPDFDPSFFLGKMLELISFSVNTIVFQFDGDVGITLQSSFTHKIQPNDEHIDTDTVPVSDSRLMQLVGNTVRLAEANPNGTLTLHFDDGQILMFHDDSSQYESYRLTVNDSEFVV